MKAIINGREFACDVAKTEEERREGLQGVQELPSDRGMIFFHPDKKKHGYWMHNTHVPLTILFVNDDKKIVDAEHRRDTGSMRQSRPDKPVRIIIEIPYNKDMSEIIGDQVELIKDEE